MNSTPLRRLAAVAVALATAVAVPSLVAQPTSAATHPTGSAASTGATAVAKPYVLRHGVTAPVYSYRHAIRESVWVLAPDNDGDGQPDKVTVDIIRPRELDGVAKIPAIMDASPYYLCCGRGNESERKTYDAKGNPLKFPLYYDNYFVPRGYAYLAVDMAGTGRSTGCVDEGADSDIQSVKAVIDWLNGRAQAVDAKGNPVTASWSNGKVGMIGKSYDGTLTEGVAATGVRGLKTIVPISAISSWYDYDRYQGLPFSYNYPAWLSAYVEQARTQHVDCSAVNNEMSQDDADATGAYTKFWSARDYRAAPSPEASKVRASVFVVHGLQDTNVKTPNFARWWRDLGKTGVVRKMWLHRLGHVDPFDTNRQRWVATLHRWFDNQLMGIDNGILDQPRVDVEVRPNHWVQSDTWPIRSRTTTLDPHADGTLVAGTPDTGTASFVNDPTQSEARAIAQGKNPNRLLFLTSPLASHARISGTSIATMSVKTSVPTGQIGVALVDYGSARRVLDTDDGAQTLSTQSCYGRSTSYDDACYYDVTRRLGTTPLQVLARGWARLDIAGTHTVTVKLTANDVMVKKGHELGLVIVGASPDWLETVDSSSSTYKVDLGATSLRVPSDLSFSTSAPSTALVPSLRDIVPGTLPPVHHGPQLPY